MEKLSDVNKKLALIFAKLEIHNMYPGWDIHFSLGNKYKTSITKRGLNDWKDGVRSLPNGYRELSLAISEEFQILEKNSKISTKNYIEGPIGVMEYGKLLGLTRQRCQYSIDSLAFRVLPSFPILSSDEQTARELITDYGGLYTIYRLDRDSKQGLIITQIPLAIRYMLQSGKKSAGNMYRIRCKTQVPNTLRKGPKNFEYDGSVTQTNEIMHWVFEKRAKERAAKDMLCMTTSDLIRTDENEYMRGHMISTSTNRTRAKHWPIVIVKDLNFVIKKDEELKGCFKIEKRDGDETGSSPTYFDDHCKFFQSFDEIKDKWVIEHLMSAYHY